MATITAVSEPNNAFVTAGTLPNYVNIVQTGGGLGTFNKVNVSTTIIAIFQGHITTSAPLASGVDCAFQLRVDGSPGTGLGGGPGLMAFGPQPSAAIPASFATAFKGLITGSHTLQLFAACIGGTPGIIPNGGGFGENAQIIEL